MTFKFSQVVSRENRAYMDKSGIVECLSTSRTFELMCFITVNLKPFLWIVVPHRRRSLVGDIPMNTKIFLVFLTAPAGSPT